MKTLNRAYLFAFVGLLLGVVGLHRFYLNLYVSGGVMLFIFFIGVAGMALGLAQLMSPLLAEIAQVGEVPDLSALRGVDYLNTAPHIRMWIVGGGLMSLASLCWWAVDLIVMKELVQNANHTD